VLRREELRLAGLADPDLFRAHLRYWQLLADASTASDPSIVERGRRLVPPGTRAPADAGPTHAELAQIVAVS
jgi:hypothetical protein